MISYKLITKNSWDLIDRVEVIETDRKYLLIVKKEIMEYKIPNVNKDVKPDAKDIDIIDIIKPESDMIIYLSL